MDFIDFQRQKRTGDDDGYPLAPAFFPPETGALNKEKPRVDEAGDAGEFKSMRREACGFLQRFIDVSVFGVHAEHGNPMIEDTGDVLVQQVESADSGKDEQKGFYEFEKGDEAEDFGVGDFHERRSS